MYPKCGILLICLCANPLPGFVHLYLYVVRAVFNSFRIVVFWFAMNTAVLNEVNSYHHGGKQVNLDKYISAKQITHIQSALFQDRFDNKRRQLSVRMHRDCYPVSAIAHLIMVLAQYHVGFLDRILQNHYWKPVS